MLLRTTKKNTHVYLNQLPQLLIKTKTDKNTLKV